jgi:hypothetical protein
MNLTPEIRKTQNQLRQSAIYFFEMAGNYSELMTSLTNNFNIMQIILCPCSLYVRLVHAKLTETKLKQNSRETREKLVSANKTETKQ